MLKPSTIPDTVHTYIQERLKALAKQHNIRILLAIESGSRAWGFPSQNSDYDVRFIYVRDLEDYLSVEAFRDVIETPLINDLKLGVPFDLNGWDVKKSLQVAIKSNAVLLEWLTSPIRYAEDKIAVTKLYQFVTSSAHLPSLAYHYDRLARNAWKQIEASEDYPRLKHYCYALRPALVIEWINRFHGTPPMDIYSICKELKLQDRLAALISKLVSTKALVTESDTISRITALDEFILSVLKDKVERPNIHPDNDLTMEADQLFRELIKK